MSACAKMTDKPLTTEERADFARCEGVIEEGEPVFLRVGLALRRISERRYYREDYRNFEDYLKRRWPKLSKGLSRAHAYRAITHARAVEDLSPIGDKSTPSSQGNPLPSNENQTRPLSGLATPEEKQTVWRGAVEAAGGEPPSGRDVAEARKRFEAMSPEERVKAINDRHAERERSLTAARPARDPYVADLIKADHSVRQALRACRRQGEALADVTELLESAAGILEEKRGALEV